MDLSILSKIYSSTKRVVTSPDVKAVLAGCAIPLICLLYILYVNFLPFGYNKSFSIKIGSENDTAISTFYLEPSPGLSERLIDDEGRSYRNLNGIGVAKFKPSVDLQGAQVEVSSSNKQVLFIPNQVNITASSTNWDYMWDFSKSIPEGLRNNGVFYFEGSSYFDGGSSVEFVSSSNMFETEPFTLYAEWTPANSEDNFQEIVGHYNWELLQEKNQVRFMVGRMNQKDGPFYSSEFLIQNPQTFFSTSHTAIATYAPDSANGQGYIELYIDGNFVKRTPIGKDVIWKDYNGERNITFGKSDHGTAKYFKGMLKNVSLKKGLLFSPQEKSSFLMDESKEVRIPFVTTSTVPLHDLTLHAQR